MKSEHERFAAASALAVSGALEEREFAEWAHHMAKCTECRVSLEEAICVSAMLSVARPARLRLPQGMAGRFAARAVAQGVLARETVAAEQRTRAMWLPAALGVAAVACVAMILLAHRGRIADHPRESTVAVNASHRNLAPAPPAEGRVRARLAAHHRSPAPTPSPSISLTELPSTALLKVQIRAQEGEGVSLSPARFEFGRGTQGAFPTAYSQLAPLSVFLWSTPVLPSFPWKDNVSSCEDPAAYPLPREWIPAAEPPPRVFCYNPRVALLTSLDLSHAASSNAPEFNVRSLAVHFVPDTPR